VKTPKLMEAQEVSVSLTAMQLAMLLGVLEKGEQMNPADALIIATRIRKAVNTIGGGS
jgi:hypothetical protein